MVEDSGIMKDETRHLGGKYFISFISYIFKRLLPYLNYLLHQMLEFNWKKPMSLLSNYTQVKC